MDDEEMPPFFEPPKDLHELYMMARMQTFNVEGFYSLYFKILFLIDVGKEMLPDADEECQHIKKMAENLLKDDKAYPRSGQMEYTDAGNYRISTGSQDTGLIEVHREDIEHGMMEAKEQKSTTLLPRLKNLDNMIFKKLVQFGVIEIRKESMEDVMLDSIMGEIQKEIYEREE